MVGKSLVSIDDYTKDDYLKILELAARYEKNPRQSILQGYVVATLFFEPSTRTRLSFESAVNQLGGRIIGFSDSGTTSASKGETLRDTMKMVSNYSDLIVMRHPIEGSARWASEMATVPVVNAGDGANQHPTQTFLDLFTIKESFGRLDNLKIGMMGDLKYGRTVHSLASALAMFNNEMVFISPPSLQMPGQLLKELDDGNIRYRNISDLEEAGNHDLDILYVTRIQKERFGDPLEYKKVAGIYRITQDTINTLGEDIRVMHPLPRVDEIAEEVDSMPNAIYFTQAHNGIPTRQALLGLVTGGLD